MRRGDLLHPRRISDIASCANRIRTSKLSTWSHQREKDVDVNAFVTFADGARRVEHVDGPLQNLPIAVKDNICTKDMPTTCSSSMLRKYMSPFDATVVKLLREAGADIVGKTNCDEFGMGSANVHTVHGPVINPYQVPSPKVPWSDREARSAGGSSGGSAAAVAAGMCYAALSTDTGGSTRLPAAYCGVVGHKPSYGIISRWGVVSFADSLDCVGILAQSVADAATVFNVLSVFDEKDPTAASPEVRRKAAQSSRDTLDSLGCGGEPTHLKSLTIGIPQEYFPKELNESAVKPLRQLIGKIKSLGANVIPCSLPMTPYALSAYYVIASAEASSNLARFDGIQYGNRIRPPPGSDNTKVSNVYAHTRSHGFGHEVQKRILLGTYALTADAFDNYFLQAQRIRKLVQADFDAVFRCQNPLARGSQRGAGGVDLLLHPSAIGSAPLLAGAQKTTGLDAYVQDVLTVPASLAGLPALSIPAGLADDEWPVGVSIVGQWGSDEVILKIGELISSK